MQFWETDPKLKSVRVRIERTKVIKLCRTVRFSARLQDDDRRTSHGGRIPAYLCLEQVRRLAILQTHAWRERGK
jgi:hypothetical protein